MNARFEIIKELADNLILFGKTISPKVFYLPTPLFHYELAKILMDRLNTQVCIQAPRGFGKSTLAVLMILHHIIYDPGDKVIIIQSKTQDEAKNRLAKIKNIISYSQNFIRIYGYAGEEVAETWTDKKIKTRLGNIGFSIRAIGTGMPARGTLESGLEILEDGSFDIGDDTRITLYLVDDPDDEDNTLTKESMRQNYSKFAGNKEGLDSRTGRVLVIGTPVRQGCIVDLLYNSEGWVTKKYQAIDEGGNLLWEELRNKSWLDSKKEEYKGQGFLSKFYSEFQCEIVGDEDQLFKEEYIQYWDGYLECGEYGNFIHITNLNGELKEPIIKPVNVYIGIDPASSTKQSADYSVTLPVAYDADENIYVLPYFRDRVTPTDHAEQIINTVKATHPNRGHVETVGYQEMLRQYLKKRLREENITLPGLEIKFTPRSEKNARLEDLHPFFYNRKVFVQPNMRALIDELLSYPRGKYDDTIDALYYATRKLLKPTHTHQENEYNEDLKLLISRGVNNQKVYSWKVA